MKGIKYLNYIMEAISDNLIDFKINHNEELRWDGDAESKLNWKRNVLSTLNSILRSDLLDEFINNEDNYWIMTQDFFESNSSKIDLEEIRKQRSDLLVQNPENFSNEEGNGDGDICPACSQGFGCQKCFLEEAFNIEDESEDER